VVVIGRRERPRLLVLGTTAESDFGQHLAKLAPTIRFLGGGGELTNFVRQQEWDAIVLVDEAAYVDEHLFVLQFGGESLETVTLTNKRVVSYSAGPATFATEFIIPNDLPLQVSRLVRQELAPTVQARSFNTTLRIDVNWYRGQKPAFEDVFDSFLADADGHPIAGRLPRSGHTQAERWFLPSYTPNPERWATAAFELWREAAPERFPSEAGWRARPEWRTDAENAASAKVEEIAERREQALAALDEELAAASTIAVEATARAELAERLLLTSQGDDLVAEVKSSLEELGFSVVDADAEVATPGDKREDLRVYDPALEGWVALVEVRGYTRGAQLNDLLRLGRFATRFLRDQKRDPDRTWYVVNQLIASDPSTRPIPLASNAAEVETFAEDGGLVLDTRELFSMRMAVRSGAMTSTNARAALRSAKGRLSL